MTCSAFIDDNWYRAQIESHRPNCVVDVFLVDFGKHVHVEWHYLRALDEQFKSLPMGVTRCNLVDIAPKNNLEWGTEVNVELKRLCKNRLKAIVCETRSNSVGIELFIVKRTTNYQINAYLAKHSLVRWIGDVEMIVERANEMNESAMSAAIMKEASQREFRQPIKILEIISPSEFYVTLVKYEGYIKKMHTHIQNAMKSYEPPEKKTMQWKEGDLCLVNFKLGKDGKKNWYRGRIESNMDNKNFTVFLRDHGQSVFTMLSDIAKISPSISIVIDGANKCHLANIKPTSSDWAKAAIDEFRHMTVSGEEFDMFSASSYGELKDDSSPIYLWGRKKPTQDDPLFGAPLNWTNINEVFASRGYADCYGKFKTIVDCEALNVENTHKEMTDFFTYFDKLSRPNQGLNTTDDDIPLKESKVFSDEDDFVLEAELDPENENFSTKKVTAWIPAKTIKKYYFLACPTYVDNNAVIYLHEESRNDYLKQLNFTINKLVPKIKTDESYAWKVDEPCMVQYHLDKCFYRGLIKEVLPNKQYKVSVSVM